MGDPDADWTCHRCGRPTRRQVLAGVAAGTASLAGCSGGDGDAAAKIPGPVALSNADTCELCGMVVPEHPGPSAEIFYRQHTPSGHPNPAVFDSIKEAFQYDFGRQNRDWQRVVLYVTDYSTVDYELIERKGRKLISAHVAAEAFANAREVTFVADSAVEGSMGKDLIAFSAKNDARSFQEENGGKLFALKDVTPDLLAQL